MGFLSLGLELQSGLQGTAAFFSAVVPSPREAERRQKAKTCGYRTHFACSSADACEGTECQRGDGWRVH